jgi:hypothetical protein
MATVTSKLISACSGGIGKINDPIMLNQVTAQTYCSGIAVKSFLKTFTVGDQRQDFTGSVGFVATNGASQITITQLGVYVIAGGTQTHTLTLSNFLCTTTLATATINFTGLSGWQYVTIIPTPPLTGVAIGPANQFKLWMDVTLNGDLWAGSFSTFTSYTDATINSDAYDTPVIKCPGLFATIGAILGGLNFKYKVP